ncbi:hypothetical protein GCM10027447_07000 [Glycomyces halotolerans]
MGSARRRGVRSHRRADRLALWPHGQCSTIPLELSCSEFVISGELPDESIEEIVDTVFPPALKATAR